MRHFQQFGAVLQATVSREFETLRHRGFGFVTFADESVIPTVLLAVNTIDGKYVDVKRVSVNTWLADVGQA